MVQPQFITEAEARKIILGAQGLITTAPFGTGKQAVARAIRHLGYVQLDTISVVERAHHHVLWSRIPGYQPDWLTRAQTESRDVYEYWAHAAAFLPMEHYRYSLPVMQHFREQKDRWPKSSVSDMRHVLNRIRKEGPLMSRDFVSDHKGGTWWDWKPTKWALQRLFFEGKLMVSHRQGFQRLYDLPERVLPEGLDISPPGTKAYYEHLILTTLRAQGLAEKKDIVHLRKTDAGVFQQVLTRLIHEKRIIPVTPGSDKTYYMLNDHPIPSSRFSNKVKILSPFDNVVIWRNRLRDIFYFDYTLECYQPSHKRAFGYFCLPLLFRDQFIGRLDGKADRKTRELHVLQVHWEPGWEDMNDDPAFHAALSAFTAFNQCDGYALPALKKRK